MKKMTILYDTNKRAIELEKEMTDIVNQINQFNDQYDKTEEAYSAVISGLPEELKQRDKHGNLKPRTLKKERQEDGHWRVTEIIEKII